VSVFAVCGAAVITAVLALMIRRESPQSAMLLSIASGVVILLSVLRNIPATLSGINAVVAEAGIDTSQLMILVKVIGICFITEFTCDCVTEAGMLSLSTNISFAGKIIVVLTALPLFEQIITIIRTLGEAL